MEINLSRSKIDEFRKCIARELKFRESCYPRWVQSGKMKQEQADFELSTMREMKDYFDWLQIHSAPEQGKLF